MLQVDTVTFTQPQDPLTFASSAQVFVHDAYGGHVYFGHYQNPGAITNINLASFTVQSSLILEYDPIPLIFLG